MNYLIISVYNKINKTLYPGLLMDRNWAAELKDHKIKCGKPRSWLKDAERS